MLGPATCSSAHATLARRVDPSHLAALEKFTRVVPKPKPSAAHGARSRFSEQVHSALRRGPMGGYVDHPGNGEDTQGSEIALA